MTQSSDTPVTQADEEQFLTIPLAHRVAMGGNGRKAVLNALARHRTSSTASSVEPTRVQKYLGDEAAARERLATFPDAVRQRLTDWQEGQSEWFSDTLLEVVAEFIAFDDAARSDVLANKAGGLWYRRWHAAQTRVGALEASLANTPAASSVGADWQIKPLKWQEPHPSASYPQWSAQFFGMRFEARIDTSRASMFGKFPLTINGEDAGQKFETVEDAKAFAQAAFESRLRDVMAAALAASSHPASAISDATRRMEETLGAKFVPASAGDEALREAEAWLRAISNWLLAMDHDMSLPDGILDTDPLDIADKLRALSATPSHAGETERLRIAQLERYLRRARRFIGSQPCKIADDIDAYFVTDKGEASRG